jgi:pheromone shutdown protein TraB
VTLCTKLTWLFALPNVIRVAIQWPIYLTGNVGLLAAAKIALGWPLFAGALALMLAVLARGHTPVAPQPSRAD